MHRPIRCLVTLGAAAWLGAGCSLIHPYEAPAVHREVPGGAPLPDPIKDTRVPLAGGAESAWPGQTRQLTLLQAIDRALEKNLDQKLAEAEEQIRLSRFQAMKGTLLPSLRIEGGVMSQDGEVQGSFGKLKDVKTNRVNPSYAVAYEVNFLAELQRTYAARKDLDAAVLRTLDTEQRLMLRVAELYENLVLAKASVRIAEKVVHNSEKIVNLARARVSAGTGKATDVTRAEARQARDRLLLVEMKNLWEQKSIALAVVLRLAPTTLLEPAEEALAPRSLAPAPGQWDPTRAAAARPDLAAARLDARRADHETTAAWWDLLAPDVQAAFRESLIGTRWGNLNKRVDLGLFLGWDLSFDKFSRVKEKRAEAAAARLRRARLEDRAAGEVAAARQEVAAARDRIELARTGVEAAAKSLRINLALFEQGQVLALEVLDAEDTLAQAELNLARSIVTYNLAQVRLLTAAGAIARESFKE